MITDPQAVAFCNQSIRPLADLLAQGYIACKQINILFAAKGLAALIPNDPAQVVIDGAATAGGTPGDGRTIITGADVNALLTIAAAWQATCEANGNALALQIGKIAVNP